MAEFDVDFTEDNFDVSFEQDNFEVVFGEQGPQGPSTEAVAYSALTNYEKGNLVFDTAGNFYGSRIDDNLGNPLTDEVSWITLGVADGVVTTFGTLTDVTFGTLTDGQIASYDADSGMWVNTTPADGQNITAGNGIDISDAEVISVDPSEFLADGDGPGTVATLPTDFGAVFTESLKSDNTWHDDGTQWNLSDSTVARGANSGTGNQYIAQTVDSSLDASFNSDDNHVVLSIAEDGVTTDKINDGAVTPDKLGTIPIDTLSDVNTTAVAPIDDDILTWDQSNTRWHPLSLSDNATYRLDNLNDISETAPTDEQILIYDADTSTWVPGDQTGGGGTYTAGNGLDLSADNEFSIDTDVVAELKDLPTNSFALSHSNGTVVQLERWRDGASVGFLLTIGTDGRLDAAELADTQNFNGTDLKSLAAAGTQFQIRNQDGDLVLDTVTVASTVNGSDFAWVRVDETITTASFLEHTQLSSGDVIPVVGQTLRIYIVEQDYGFGLIPDFDNEVAVDATVMATRTYAESIVVDTLAGLTDVPDIVSGDAGKVLSINADEDGYIWAEDSGSGNSVPDYNNASLGSIDDGSGTWTYTTGDNPLTEGQVAIDDQDAQGYLLQFRTEDIDTVNAVSVRFFQIGYGSPISFATYAVSDLSITDSFVDVSVVNGPLSGDDILASLPANDTALSISVSVNEFRLPLGGLSDVSETTPTDGQVLAWDNTNSTWAPADEDTGAENLGDLSDVNVAGVADGFILRYEADNTRYRTHSLYDTMRLYGGADIDQSSGFTVPQGTGTHAIAIGSSSVASEESSSAFGDTASATHAESSAIGFGATTDQVNEVRVGAGDTHITIDPIVAGTEGADNQLASVRYVKDRISDASRVVNENINGIQTTTRAAQPTPWGDYRIDPYQSDDTTFQIATQVTFFDASMPTYIFYPPMLQNIVNNMNGGGLTTGDIPDFFEEITDVQTPNNVGGIDGNDENALGWKYTGYQNATVWMNSPVQILSQWRWVNHDSSNESIFPPNVTVKFQLVHIKPSGVVYDIDDDSAVVIAETDNFTFYNPTRVAAGATVAHDVNLTFPTQTQSQGVVNVATDDMIALRYRISFKGNGFAYDNDADTGLSLDAYIQNTSEFTPLFGIEHVTIGDSLVVETADGDLVYTDHVSDTSLLVVNNNEGAPFIPGGSLADTSVTSGKLADNAVTNAKVADDAIGLAELSATGTPSATTYLRGDNTWAPVTGGAGEDYFIANFDGTVPTAAGTNSIAIGEDSTAGFDEAVIIGYGASVDVADDVDADTALVDGAIAIGRLAQVFVESGQTNSRHGIAIGERAYASGQNSIAIGSDNLETARTEANGAQAMAIGRDAKATASFAVAVGPGAEASAGDTVALGRDTTASAIDAIAIGVDSNGTAANSVAMGRDANSTAVNAVAIGKDTDATAADSVAMGDDVNATGSRAVAMGSSSDASGDDSMAMGSLYTNPDDSTDTTRTAANGNNSLAIGAGSIAHSNDNIVIGLLAQAGDSEDATNATGSIAIGQNTLAQDNDCIAIGAHADASGANSIAIGGSVDEDNQTVIGGDRAIAIGYQASSGAGADGTVVIGENASVGTDADGAFAIGKDASSTVANVGVLGSTSHEVRLGRQTTAEDDDAQVATKKYVDDKVSSSTKVAQFFAVEGVQSFTTPGDSFYDTVGKFGFVNLVELETIKQIYAGVLNAEGNSTSFDINIGDFFEVILSTGDAPRKLIFYVESKAAESNFEGPERTHYQSWNVNYFTDVNFSDTNNDGHFFEYGDEVLITKLDIPFSVDNYLSHEDYTTTTTYDDNSLPIEVAYAKTGQEPYLKAITYNTDSLPTVVDYYAGTTSDTDYKIQQNTITYNDDNLPTSVSKDFAP